MADSYMSLSKETHPDSSENLTTLNTPTYLLYYSNKYINLGGGYTSLPGSVQAYLTASPRNEYLPDATLSAEMGPYRDPSVTFSVDKKIGHFLLGFEKRFEEGFTTNTVSGEAGPFSAFYSEINPTNNQYSQKTNLGGTVNIGPNVQLYGQSTRSGQNVVDPRDAPYFKNPRFDRQTGTIGARGSLRLGPSTLSGNVSREFGKEWYPQHISQEFRHAMAQDPITNYRLGWEGPVGPGRLGLQGTLRDVRNAEMEPSASGAYTIPNPLGFGGQLRATSSYNPYSKFSAMFRYGMPLGGKR
jgi:hypothetical protein